MSELNISQIVLELLKKYSSERVNTDNLDKTPHSKNITVSEWNELVERYSVTAADVERIYSNLRDIASSLDTAVNGKLDSQSTPSALYGTSDNGEPAMYVRGCAVNPNWIVQRDANGDILISNNPKSEDAAISVKILKENITKLTTSLNKTIEASLENKVNKTSAANKLYGTNANGNPLERDVSASVLPSRVVQRTGGSEILVPEKPASDFAATSKKYVDTQITEKVGNVSNEKINALEERVSDLENLTLTNINDSSEAYEKVAPAVVGSTALVDMIGGASEKVIGKNLANPANITNFNNCELVSVNADGSIDIAIYPNDEGVAWCTWSPDVDWNKYRYYYWNESSSEVIDGYFGAMPIHSSGDVELIAEADVAQTINFKLMVWGTEEDLSNEEGDTFFYNEEVPFEPYTETFQHAKVEKIESYGANLLNLDVPQSFPSDTSVQPTDRIFTPNSYVLGMSAANYYVWDNAILHSITENKIDITVATGYGIAFPLKLLPNTKYTVSYNNSGSPMVMVSNYDIKGKLLKYTTSTKLLYTFTTDEYANILLIFSISGSGKKRVTISDIMLTQGSVDIPYEPFNPEPIYTYEIPEDVIIRDGYGREGSSIEFRDDDIYLVVTKDENLEPLPTPEETVITSDFFSGINDGLPYIKIQNGGRLRFVNSLNKSVPSSVWYTVRRS